VIFNHTDWKVEAFEVKVFFSTTLDNFKCFWPLIVANFCNMDFEFKNLAYWRWCKSCLHKISRQKNLALQQCLEVHNAQQNFEHICHNIVLKLENLNGTLKDILMLYKVQFLGKNTNPLLPIEFRRTMLWIIYRLRPWASCGKCVHLHS